MTNEPLVTVASITAIVAAVIALLVAFGLNLTTDQTEAIMGIAAVLAPLAVGLIARAHVTPVNKSVKVKR